VTLQSSAAVALDGQDAHASQRPSIGGSQQTEARAYRARKKDADLARAEEPLAGLGV